MPLKTLLQRGNEGLFNNKQSSKHRETEIFLPPKEFTIEKQPQLNKCNLGRTGNRAPLKTPHSLNL